MIFIASFFLIIKLFLMQIENYNCKKCGLTIPVTCSQCDRIVDIKVVGEGCLVKENKCLDCTTVPIIKDVCLEQTA